MNIPSSFLSFFAILALSTLTTFPRTDFLSGREGIQRVRGNTDDLSDPKLLKVLLMRLDIFELIPAGLASQSLLKVQEHSLPTKC